MIPPVGPEISVKEVLKIILKSFQKTNPVIILNNFYLIELNIIIFGTLTRQDLPFN